MTKVIVTRPDNVVSNTEEGWVLKNEKLVGHLVKTHIIPLSQVDPANGTLQTGFVTRCEVYWENARSPVCTMEDPADLAWLAFDDEEIENADDSDDEASDESYEEGEDEQVDVGL